MTEEQRQEVKAKIELLQKYIAEFEEMHQCDKENLPKESFGAFTLILQGQLREIADYFE